MPVQGKCFIAGAPKANKSFVVLNLALALAKGESAFNNASYPDGTPVMPIQKPYKVLYVEMEIGPDGLKERLLGMTGGEVPNIDFYIKSRDMQLRMDTPEGKEALGNEIAQVRPDVVILDPLAKFHLSDENSAQEMGAIMRVGDRWIEKYGCSLIYVHHIGKQDFDNPRRGGDRMRGSSALFADVDTFIEVNRKSEASHLTPTIELSFEIRRGKPIQPMYLIREESGVCRYIGDKWTAGLTIARPLDEEPQRAKRAKKSDIKYPDL